MVHILVVEDDIELNKVVCRHLNMNKYEAYGCFSAREAFDCLYEKQIDLIISDIMMPEMDGFAFAEAVRKQDQNIPILFMTARDDISAKQKGYHLGIDDYMVKPVDLEELLLRIEALLRRAHIASKKRLVIGSLVLDEEGVSAEVEGRPISLTLREFQILFKMLSYPNRTFTRSQLLDEFSGVENESSLRSVDVHITNLRNKFSDCKDFKIVTVRGLGYKAVIEE